MCEMGLFGLTIPEEYGGPRRVPADLRARRRGDLPRVDERLGHHQHALHRRLHAAPARHRGPEAALPAAHGRRRVARRLLHVGAELRLGRVRDQDQGGPGRRRLRHRRAENVADQRRHRHARRGARQDRRGRGVGLPEHDHVPGREEAGLRRGRTRPHHPRQDREDGLQGRRHHRAHLYRILARHRSRSSAGRRAAASTR